MGPWEDYTSGAFFAFWVGCRASPAIWPAYPIGREDGEGRGTRKRKPAAAGRGKQNEAGRAGDGATDRDRREKTKRAGGGGGYEQTQANETATGAEKTRAASAHTSGAIIQKTRFVRPADALVWQAESFGP